MKQNIALVICLLVAGLAFFFLFHSNVHLDTKKARPISQDGKAPVQQTNKAGSFSVMPATNSVEQVTAPMPSAIVNREALKAELRKRVSGTVACSAGLTDERRYYQRLDAIRKLGNKLSKEDFEALYYFLDAHFTNQNDLSLLEFNALKNNILNMFYIQEKLPQDAGFQLVRMFRDKDHDEVWRNYCLQHMALYYVESWTSGSVLPDDPQLAEMLKALWEGTEECNSTIAGTALISLSSLTARCPNIGREQIAESACRVAEEESTCEGSRISALQVAANLGDPRVLSTARVLAQTAESVTLRMSAIAAIGTVGEMADIELLQILAQDKEARIRFAAQAALTRMTGRQASE